MLKLRNVSRYFINAVLAAVLLSSCMGEFSPKVEQYVGDYEWYDGDKRFFTVVWYHGEIVWCRNDKMQTLNDSIVKAAYKEAVVVKTALSNSH